MRVRSKASSTANLIPNPTLLAEKGKNALYALMLTEYPRALMEDRRPSGSLQESISNGFSFNCYNSRKYLYPTYASCDSLNVSKQTQRDPTFKGGCPDAVTINRHTSPPNSSAPPAFPPPLS